MNKEVTLFQFKGRSSIALYIIKPDVRCHLNFTIFLGSKTKHGAACKMQ